MSSIAEGILIFAAISETILGVLANGFIGLVNCVYCVKYKKFSTIDFILTGLAISRIFLIWLIITDGFMRIFSTNTYPYDNVVHCISYLWVLINQSSVWFATSLSIFYFLKVANFSHHVFLWLKGRISVVLPLLLGSLLISWLLTFSQLAEILNDHRWTYRNSTWFFNMSRSQFFIKQILLNLGVIFYFILSLVTCFLLIFSLWRHNRRMQLTLTGLRDTNTEAHMRAMRVLVSFIILFILYFIGVSIETMSFTVPENRLLFIFGMTTSTIYPSVHSLIIIVGNSKLKQAFLRVLLQLRCCKKGKIVRTT
ncbi:taste receptor type 2 member 10 [Tupaia chinensis]|uniref:taste receptor type 2 member 10 n=1 Tax=Tupaia chinensis TaxID=246437 RepID=UPI0000F5ED15|nr:taste receptor type 2 member 10 [Tupaia chinensis]